MLDWKEKLHLLNEDPQKTEDRFEAIDKALRELPDGKALAFCGECFWSSIEDSYPEAQVSIEVHRDASPACWEWNVTIFGE